MKVGGGGFEGGGDVEDVGAGAGADDGLGGRHLQTFQVVFVLDTILTPFWTVLDFTKTVLKTVLYGTKTVWGHGPGLQVGLFQIGFAATGYCHP